MQVDEVPELYNVGQPRQPGEDFMVTGEAYQEKLDHQDYKAQGCNVSTLVCSVVSVLICVIQLTCWYC